MKMCFMILVTQLGSAVLTSFQKQPINQQEKPSNSCNHIVHIYYINQLEKADIQQDLIGPKVSSINGKVIWLK